MKNIRKVEKRIIVLESRYNELLKKEKIYDILKNGLTERQFSSVVISAQLPNNVDELSEAIYESNKRMKELGIHHA